MSLQMLNPKLDRAVPQHQSRADSRSDKRQHVRRPSERELWLSDLQGETVLRCKCKDLSAGGIFATAPIGYGLAVGQRYELLLEPTPEPGGSLLVGASLGYATIIRTHMKLGDDDATVGFAMRFDQPKYLPL